MPPPNVRTIQPQLTAAPCPGPPGSLEMSGPATVQQQTSVTYSCAVQGGHPAPAIRWTVDGAPAQGAEQGGGVSTLSLETGDREAAMTVACQAENTEGVISEAINVNTEFLPRTLRIQVTQHIIDYLSPFFIINDIFQSPTVSVVEGGEATVSCLASHSRPAPSFTWTIEKFGTNHDTLERTAEAAVSVAEDDSLLVTETFTLEADAGLTHAEVSCAAHVAGLGQVSSDTVTIVVEAAEVIEYTTEAAEEETTTSSDLFSDYSLEPKLVEGDSSEEYADADADTDADAAADKNFAKLIPTDDDDDADATEQKEKVLWIPYNSKEDIEDYQDNFSPKYEFEADSKEEQVTRYLNI